MFAIVIVDLHLYALVLMVSFRTIVVVDDFSVYRPNGLYVFPGPHIAEAHPSKYVHRSEVDPNKSIFVPLMSENCIKNKTVNNLSENIRLLLSSLSLTLKA